MCLQRELTICLDKQQTTVSPIVAGISSDLLETNSVVIVEQYW